MENFNVVKVKKSVSPLAYIGIIILVLIFAFVSLIIALNLIGGDSYKKAEMKFFASSANLLQEGGNIRETIEYELNFGLNTDSSLFGEYIGEVNDTVIKGIISVDGSDYILKTDYLNGDKKILGSAMQFKNNAFSIIFPEITNVMLTISPEAFLAISEANASNELDYDEFMKTCGKIVEKYFEMVGEPEIVDKKYTVVEGGMTKECIWYRIDFDSAFISKLVKFATETILENENLVSYFGAEVEEELRSSLDETWSYSDEVLRMDVFASGNNIIRRDIYVYNPDMDNTAENSDTYFKIVTIDNTSDGYMFVSAKSDDDIIKIENKYTKDNDKLNGTINLSLSDNDYLIGGETLTVKYQNVFFDEKYGIIGDFRLTVPQIGFETIFTSKLDERYDFSCDFLYAGQAICYLNGFYDVYDEYKEEQMPDTSSYNEFVIESFEDYENDEFYEMIDILTEDFTDFLLYDFYETFTDNNGNYDLIGYLFSQLFYSGVNDFINML